MKKITLLILIAVCSIAAKAQTQYIYNVTDSTTYVYLIDSTHIVTQAWPKNTLQIQRIAGTTRWKNLSLTTYTGLYVASWDTTNIYILAPTIDSGYRKLRNIIF
jgi:hypothetical protein